MPHGLYEMVSSPDNVLSEAMSLLYIADDKIAAEFHCEIEGTPCVIPRACSLVERREAVAHAMSRQHGNLVPHLPPCHVEPAVVTAARVPLSY